MSSKNTTTQSVKANPKVKNDDKAAEYLEGWQRARAEFDNYRKQTETAVQEARQQGVVATLLPLLALHDNFKAITEHVPKEYADNAWSDGVLHVARQFAQELEQLGVQEILPENEDFNPELHEAVSNGKKKGVKAGTVLEVVQPGYIYGEHVLRPAKVKVSS